MKNCIRIGVLAGLLAWPAVESYRLYVAKQELQASAQLQKNVQARLETARFKNTQVAKKSSDTSSVGKP